MAGCREPRRNLVLVTMDTTRADRIGCYGYDAHTPNIDRAAAGGTVFDRAFTVAPITGPAHASILSGTYPPFHQMHDNGVSVLPDGLVTLAEVFQANRYFTAGFVAAYPVKGTFGFGQGFGYFSDRFDAATGNVFVTNLPTVGVNRRPGELVAREFEAWLDAEADLPFFAWVHFYDPHLPHEAPEHFAELFPGDSYDAEIAYMDDCIGTLMRSVERRGLGDGTGWVLVGDHGEGLGDHGEVTHALLAYNSTLRVPLIVNLPWLDDQLPRSGTNVSVTDIAPTVIEAFDLDLGSTHPVLQGRSMVPLLKRASNPVRAADRELYFECFLPFFHYGWAPLTGLVTGRWKLIRGARPELYDLASDIDELRAAIEPTMTARLETRLDDFTIALGEDRPATTRAEVSAEDIRQLEALGYVASGKDQTVFVDKETLRGLPEPRDNLHLWDMYNAALSAARSARWLEALDKGREVLEQQPRNKGAKLLLAGVATSIGDFDQAEILYEELVMEHPTIDVLHQAAKYALERRRDPDRALRYLVRILEISPRDLDALTQLGRVQLQQGDIAAAERTLRTARDLDPRSRDAAILLAELLDKTRGDVQAAEGLLQAMVVDHPFDPVAHYNLAVLLVRRGRTGEAMEHLRRSSAFAQGGVFPPAHLAMASLLEQVGDFQGARRLLDELILHTDSAELHRQAKMMHDRIAHR